MIVDAHLHLWRRDRGDYGWLTPDAGPLWADFDVADATAVLARAGVDRAILVQAAPTEAETAFLLDAASRAPWAAGVVGWTDLTAPDAPDRIAALAETPGLVGLRPMIQDIADADWMLGDDVRAGFAALAASGLAFDALVRPVHLPRLLRLVERLPELRVVLDHAGKPAAHGPVSSDWAAAMAALAEAPNVACKLSGLITEAGPDWSLDGLAPTADALFETFGASRLIWGGDWPVCRLAGDHHDWFEAARTLVAARTDAEGAAAVFGLNALRIYGVAS